MLHIRIWTESSQIMIKKTFLVCSSYKAIASEDFGSTFTFTLQCKPLWSYMAANLLKPQKKNQFFLSKIIVLETLLQQLMARVR